MLGSKETQAASHPQAASPRLNLRSPLTTQTIVIILIIKNIIDKAKKNPKFDLSKKKVELKKTINGFSSESSEL
jgi:hypothetical protein